MAQLYSIVTPNLTGTKLSLDSLYELALSDLSLNYEYLDLVNEDEKK